MSQESNAYDIVDGTKISIGGSEITEYELKQLRDLGVITDYRTNNYQLTSIEFDAERLQEVAFDHSILKDVASSVEVEVMRVFRGQDTGRLTTSEISDEVGRASSSVSRALTRLVEKGQITKVQRGVYSYP